ncbi:MAG: LytR/AlgR family response regulator transcription factor [Lachnospiraceae bacterium]
MTTYQVAICDDDIVYASLLKSKIETYISTGVTGSIRFEIDVYSSGMDLLENTNKSYDIFFMDICINKESGIDLGIKLKSLFPSSILVFITSFIDFSLDGYKANAFRYILKSSVDALLGECINDILLQFRYDNSIISIPQNGVNTSIPINSIIYIENIFHNQHIHLCSSEKMTCSLTMTSLEKELSQYNFIRIQKGYLINPKYIKIIKNYTVTLTSGEILSISRKNYSMVKKAYLEYLTKAPNM